MNIVATLFLALTWLVWLAARFTGNELLSGLTFIVAYLGAAIALSTYKGVSGQLATAFKLFGLSFFFKAIGDMEWLAMDYFPDLQIDSGRAFLMGIPYYLSNILLLLGAWRLYKAGQELFGFSKVWIAVSLALAVIFSVGSALMSDTFGQGNQLLNVWYAVDNTVAALGAFMLISIAFLTIGGQWSKWTLPLGIAFGFSLLSGLYSVMFPNWSGYGGVGDWLWVLEVTVIFLMLIVNNRSVRPAVAA